MSCFDCKHLHCCDSNKFGVTKWVEPCKSCHLDPTHPSFERRPLPRHYLMQSMTVDQLSDELIGLVKVAIKSKDLDKDIRLWLKELV